MNIQYVPDVEVELKRRFPVTKDVGCIRKSRKRGGKLLEDVEEAIAQWALAKWTAEAFETILPEVSPGIVSVTLQVTSNLGIYTVSARFGVPTLVVGVKDEETWIELRTHLRQEGLLR